MAAMTRRMFLMGGVSIFPYLYLERLSVAVRRYLVPIRALPAAVSRYLPVALSRSPSLPTPASTHCFSAPR